MRKENFTLKSLKALLLAIILIAGYSVQAQHFNSQVRDDGTIIMNARGGYKATPVIKNTITKAKYSPSEKATFYDDFDSYSDWSTSFGDWTFINGNEPLNCIGFGSQLPNSGYENYAFPGEVTPYTAIIFNPSQTYSAYDENKPMPCDDLFPPYSGEKFMASFLSFTAMGKGQVNNDKWMITPKISLGEDDVFSFFASSGHHIWCVETFDILVSTTGTNISDFTKIASGKTDSVAWERFNFLLKDYGYANQDVYIAIHNVTVAGDQYKAGAYLFIDDVEVAPVSNDPILECLNTEWNAGIAVEGDEIVSDEFIIRNMGKGNLLVNSISGFEGTEFSTSMIASEVNLSWQETYSFTISYKPTSAGDKKIEAIISTTGGDVTLKLSGETSDEGFESIDVPDGVYIVDELPEGWKSINADGGLNKWITQKGYPNSGTKAIRSDEEEAAANDDWVITPALSIKANVEDKIAFYSRKYWWNAPNTFEVRLSTTGTNVDDFDVLLATESTTTDYKRFEYNLDNYDGKNVYVAIRHISPAGEAGAMFLDDFFLPEIKVADYDLYLKSFVPNTTPSVGKEEIYTIVVKNTGNNPVSNFKVQLMKVVEGAADEVIAQTPVSNVVTVGEELSVELKHTFLTEENVQIYAKVVLNSDENSSNNESEIFDFRILAANMDSYLAGDGIKPMNTPVYMLSDNSFTQFVYEQSEINFQGLISEIAFYNDFKYDASAVPLKIWMGTTSKSYFEVGVNQLINPSEMDLVFDGIVDMPVGQNRIDISLNPYMYMGGNMVMLVQKVGGPEFSNSQTFFGSEARDNCTVEYGNYDGSIDEITSLEVKEYMLEAKIPKTTFTFIAEFGGVSGFVSGNGTNLENALVSVENTHFNYTTKANGYYEFPALSPATYTFATKCHGFYDLISTDIVIEKDVNITKDLELTPLPKLKLSANVQASDEQPISAFNVKLQGYDEVYLDEVVSDNKFALENIYGENTYTLTIECEGYSTYVTEVTFGAEDIDLGTLIINELAFKPEFVTATLSDDNNSVLVNWYTPLSGSEITYQYDTESNENSYAFTAPAEVNFWMGNKFPVSNKGAVNKVAIYGYSSVHEPVDEVTVEFFDGDRISLWKSEPFVLEGGKWSVIEVPEVRFDGTFYVMVHYNNLPSKTNCPHYDASGDKVAYYYDEELGWIPWEQAVDGLPAGAFRIRALATIYGASSKQNSVKEIVDETMHGNVADFKIQKTAAVKGSAQIEWLNESSKSLESYKVYRGVENESFDKYTQLTSEAISDTAFVDNGFGELENKIYKYAVTAIYTNGVESEPTYSNRANRSTVIPVEFKVSTNELDVSSIEGAKVYATNYDGYSEHKYEFELPENGELAVSLAYGNYDIRVEKAGFETYELINVEIFETKIFTIELKELLTAPEKLFVENKANGTAVFSWNNGFENYFADFEDGRQPEGWQFVDVDGDGQNWEIASKASGAIVIGNYAARSWSFDNYEGLPLEADNYIISPKVKVGPNFVMECYAIPNAGNYPAESYKVKVSTTGTDTSDFIYTIAKGILSADENGNPKYDFRKVDLTEFMGREIYVAFIHDGFDQYAMTYDNLYIGEDKQKKSLIEYEVTLNGDVVGSTTDTQIDLTGLVKGQTYLAGVKAHYSSGESIEAQYEFEYAPGIVEYTLNIDADANSNLDVTGAEISLVNQNGDYNYIYTDTLTEAKTTKLEVVPGTYDLVVKKDGFEDFKKNGIRLSDNATINVVMIEARYAPISTSVETISSTELKLSWEMSTTTSSLIGYRTYINGEEAGMVTEMEYIFSNINVDEYYELGVQAIYTTGVSEITYHIWTDIYSNQNFDINIYPVPANKNVIIEWDVNNYSVEIFNLLGQVQKQVNSQSMKTIVNVSDLNDGVYIIKLKSKDYETITKFTVKR